MKKSIAIMKSDELRGCPFGLTPISLVCKNVGQAVGQMKSILDIPPEQREKIAAANRKIYRHHQDGSRCPFADQILEGRDDMVNCDAEEGLSAGEHSVPLRPSPFYPRVFMGGINGGLSSFQLGDYSNNPDGNSAAPGNLTQGFDVPVHASDLVAAYLKTGSINLNETIEKPSQLPDFYEFEDSFLVSSTN